MPALVLVGLAAVNAPEVGYQRVDVAFGALVAAVFLVKSSNAPLCLVAGASLVCAGLGLLVALAAPLAWMQFVLASTGRLDPGTSWDGENLFRGWCRWPRRHPFSGGHRVIRALEGRGPRRARARLEAARRARAICSLIVLCSGRGSRDVPLWKKSEDFRLGRL